MKVVVKKSVYDEIMLEKSFRGYPVGTIREWEGVKYRKTAPNKWQRIYEGKNASTDIDKEYFAAIKSGDMEKVQKMVKDRAEKMGFKDAIPEQGNGYKIRTTRPPRKTRTVYKCFFVDTHGKPSALFVDNNASLPMNVWLNANDTFHFMAENGNDYVPTMSNTTNKDAGKTGISVKIPNENVKKELIKHGYLPQGSNAKTITCVAYRPGWHGGDLPFFPQGGKKDVNSNYGNVHRWNQVIFEIEIDADKDYTQEARNQEKAKNKDGSLNLKKADLQYMPEGGFYQYTTNPTVKQQTGGKGDWFISGSIKIKRALTQKECDDILKANGMKEQEWEGGEMDLSKLGYTKPDFDAARKTLAPITYDDDGKIIPLSQRFNKKVDDIRKSLTIKKSIETKDFEYYRKWAIEHLKKQLPEDEKENVRKSLFLNIDEMIQKSVFPVGTIRTWSGKKYKKVAQGKWLRYYEQSSKGSEMALRNAIKEIEKLEEGDFEGLLQVILKHKSRFSNDYGKPLAEVEKISRLAANKQADWSSGNRHLKDNIDKILAADTDEKRAKFYKKNFVLAQTPQFLKDIGMNGENFIISYGVISHHKNKDKNHNLTADDWRAVCDSIDKPLFVTPYKNDFNMFLPIKKNGKNILVGVKVKKQDRNLIINSVPTVFAKNHNLEKMIKETPRNEILYLDKKIATSLGYEIRNPSQEKLATAPRRIESGKNVANPTELTASNSQQVNGEGDNSIIPQTQKKSSEKWAKDVCKTFGDLQSYAKDNYGIEVRSSEISDFKKVLRSFNIVEKHFKEIPELKEVLQNLDYRIPAGQKNVGGLYVSGDKCIYIGNHDDKELEEFRYSIKKNIEAVTTHEVQHAITKLLQNKNIEITDDDLKRQYEKHPKLKNIRSRFHFYEAFVKYSEESNAGVSMNALHNYALKEKQKDFEKSIIDEALDNLGIPKKRTKLDYLSYRYFITDPNTDKLKLSDATKAMTKISYYATTDDNECISEAISDCFCNGDNAQPLSKEISKIIQRKIKEMRDVKKSIPIAEILKSMANEILPTKHITLKSVENKTYIIAKSMGTNDYLKSIKNQFNFEMMKNLGI